MHSKADIELELAKEAANDCGFNRSLHDKAERLYLLLRPHEFALEKPTCVLQFFERYCQA